MKIDIFTLFPEMFETTLNTSILGKAKEKERVDYRVINFRDFAQNKHGQVDDTPYGGGGGMVLKPEPMFSAVESLTSQTESRPRIILMCPQGEPYHQEKAVELSREDHLIFLCGHYEGYDERIREHLVTDELSIGDYVLTGGELPALVVIDSVVRLLPGVLGNELSAKTDSFSQGQMGLLEHPHYTRPASYRGWDVPEVLLSGHHENIENWREKESLRRTYLRRPELLEQMELPPKMKEILAEVKQEEEKKN